MTTPSTSIIVTSAGLPGPTGPSTLLAPTAVKTSAYTAAASDLVPVDTTAGSVTVTLPSAPGDQAVVGVIMVKQTGANTVTVATGGTDVFSVAGGPTTFVISTLYEAITCQYARATGIWYILSEAQAASLPLTTLGDTLYENATPALARLPGNTTANKNFLTQTGTGSISAAPAWGTIAAGDLPAASTSTQGAVILDGTAADIQPDGVAAAGAKGQAADAKHVHPYQPWQFLPESYGAVGDGKVVADVSTTLNSKVITSASAGFVNATAPAGDVGKHVMIHGGNGSTQPPILDVIFSVQSPTQATLTTNNAAATVSNCPMVWGTDDTAAINSAVAAAGTYATAHSYFAEVVFGAKIYILGTGPTQVGNGSTTVTYNTQVQIPYPAAAGTSQKLVIALRGAGDNGWPQFWGGLAPNVAGTSLVSFLTTGTTPNPTFGQQSVIGGPSSSAGFTSIGGVQAFANTKVVVTGLAVWLPIYTNIYAYDFAYLSQMRVVQSSAQIFAPTGFNNAAVPPYLNNISAPSAQTMTGCGFRTPINQNNADITMHDVTAEGYGAGFRVFDHLNAGRLCTIYSTVALVLQSAGGTGHLISIQTLDAEAYTGGILANGGGTCTVAINMDTECALNTVTYDVNDGGVLHGVVRFRDSATPARTPVVSNLGAYLKLVWEEMPVGHWSSPPNVPGSTTPQQNTAWRDAAITIATGAGVTVSAIAVDGTNTGATLAASSSTTVIVPSGRNITLTYAGGTPTWVWNLL